MIDSALFALGLGFVLGLKHATEADHVVAVTTIVSEQRSVWRAGAVGALWGVGHTAALFAAGAGVILLDRRIPDGAARLLELAVALMIILLGSRVLYLLLRRGRRVHVHTHAHDGRAHTHLHFHEGREAHEPKDAHAHDGVRHAASRVGWKPLAVGVVHGLAGSAALTLLVLAEVVQRTGSRVLGLSYLLVFGAGSVGGMFLMSALVGLPFALTGARFERMNRPVRLAAGVASVAFGCYYAWAALGAA
jgi:ABC-type nickel/cobalt efflux system permease component RcnA